MVAVIVRYVGFVCELCGLVYNDRSIPNLRRDTQELFGLDLCPGCYTDALREAAH